MVERSGEIVLIKELYRDPNVISKYVRVTGYVEYANVETNLVQISHDGASLYVDTSEVPCSSLSKQCLAQFIGEVRQAKEHSELCDNVGSQDFYLKARVFRSVDGLDLALYQQAIEARREYLNTKHNNTNKKANTAT